MKSNTQIRFAARILPVLFILVVGCSRSQKEHDEKIKLRQYFIKGEQLYKDNCSNCHQTDGSGLGKVYPPLAKSDFLKNRKADVICLIRHGIAGELSVNGVSYNMPMPPNPRLTDLEIAQIATYIYNSWENEEGIIEVKTASSVLSNCSTD